MPGSPAIQMTTTGHVFPSCNDEEANMDHDGEWSDINVIMEAMNHAQKQQSYEMAAHYAKKLYYKRQNLRQDYSKDERLRDSLRHSYLLLRCSELGNKDFPPGMDDLVPLAHLLNAEGWGKLCSNMGILFLRRPTQQDLQRSFEYLNMGLSTLVSARSRSHQVLRLICQTLVDIHELTDDLGGAEAFVEKIKTEVAKEVWDKIKVGNITLVIKYCADHGFESRSHQYHQKVPGHKLSPIASALEKEHKTVFETMLDFEKRTLPPAIFSGVCSDLLLAAASTRNMDNTRTLVEYGADIHHADEEGQTALHHCQWSRYHNEGGTDVASYIIDEDQRLFEHSNTEHKIPIYNWKDKRGKTALLMACEAGHLPMIERLIEKGADPSIEEMHGKTCLWVAIDRGDIKSFRFLCDTTHFSSMVNARGPGGATPIIRAVEKASSDIKLAEMPKRLMQLGADPHILDSRRHDAFAYIRGGFDKRWLGTSSSDSGRPSASLQYNTEPAPPGNATQRTSKTGSVSWRNSMRSGFVGNLVPSLFPGGKSSKRKSLSTHEEQRMEDSDSQMNQASEEIQPNVISRFKGVQPQKPVPTDAVGSIGRPTLTGEQSRPILRPSSFGYDMSSRSSRCKTVSDLLALSEFPEDDNDGDASDDDENYNQDRVIGKQYNEEGPANANIYDSQLLLETELTDSIMGGMNVPFHSKDALSEMIRSQSPTNTSFQLMDAPEGTRQDAHGNKYTSNQSQVEARSSTYNRGKGKSTNPQGGNAPSSQKRMHDGEKNDDSCKRAALRWACPFYKKDAWRHLKCINCNFGRISDVKQHLRREHYKHYCDNCQERFNKIEERNDHCDTGGCVKAASPLSLHWINDHQRMSLKQSSKIAGNAVHQQWRSLYAMLFPDEVLPDSCQFPLYNPRHAFEQLIQYATLDIDRVIALHRSQPESNSSPEILLKNTFYTIMSAFPTRYGPLPLLVDDGTKVRFTMDYPRAAWEVSQPSENPREGEIASQSTTAQLKDSSSAQDSSLANGGHNDLWGHGYQAGNIYSAQTALEASTSTMTDLHSRNMSDRSSGPVHQPGYEDYAGSSAISRTIASPSVDQVNHEINNNWINNFRTEAFDEVNTMPDATSGIAGSSLSQNEFYGWNVNKDEPLVDEGYGAQEMGGYFPGPRDHQG